MKERPILFQGDMVRAILAGTKTQTRRLVKWRGLQPGLNLGFSGLQVERSGSNWVLTSPTRTSYEYRSVPMPCPYGNPGDRLWVRETFAKIDGQTQPWIETDYRATYTHGDRLGDSLGLKKRWTPAIHMPRAASRITLEVTGVRVQRLHGISEADAAAEGIEPIGYTGPDAGPNRYSVRDAHRSANFPTARGAYEFLWERINGADSWAANPWVWVVEFRRIEA